MRLRDSEEGRTWREGIYLATADTSLEADILVSKLAGAEIPCIKRYQGASNFMEIALGTNTIQTIDLYVPEGALEVARELIKPEPAEEV